MADLRRIYAIEDGGVVREVIDTDDGSMHFLAHQDVTGIIEHNKAWRENLDMKDHWRPVAEIPFPIVERAIQEGWFHDKAAWRRFINDSDNAALRVWEGRI